MGKDGEEDEPEHDPDEYWGEEDQHELEYGFVEAVEDPKDRRILQLVIHALLEQRESKKEQAPEPVVGFAHPVKKKAAPAKKRRKSK